MFESPSHECPPLVGAGGSARPRVERALRVWAACLVVLGVAAAAVALAAVEVARAVPASAASEWQQTRTETFSGSSLPKGCQKYTGTYAAGANAWASDDVVVKGGQLRLGLRKRAASGRAYTAGGIGCYTWAQAYGRYEIRAAVPAGAGIDSFFALWPQSTKGAATAWTGLELLAPSTQTANVTNGYGAGSLTAQVPGRFADGMHTYVLEWRPNGMRVTVDGAVLFADARAYTGKRWLGLTISTGDEITGKPTAATKLPAVLAIDYVKVWRYTGAAKPPAAPSSAPAASPTADPRVPGSVLLTSPPGVVSGAPAVERPRPQPMLVVTVVTGALVVVVIGFGMLRLILRRRR